MNMIHLGNSPNFEDENLKQRKVQNVLELTFSINFNSQFSSTFEELQVCFFDPHCLTVKNLFFTQLCLIRINSTLIVVKNLHLTFITWLLVEQFQKPINCKYLLIFQVQCSAPLVVSSLMWRSFIKTWIREFNN